MQSTAPHEFRQAATNRGENCLFNYIWTNEKPDTADRKPDCSVSLKHLDHACDNASKYPNAKVIVWIDQGMLDDRSRDTLQQYQQRFAPEKLEFRDLNTIPSYSKISGCSIWPRVDAARVLVMQHVFENASQQYIFYSDFDVEDVRPDDAVAILVRHGVALGTTKKGAIENGYFALDRQQSSSRKLIDEASAKILKSINPTSGVFPYFLKAVLHWQVENKVPSDEIVVNEVLNEMGYVIPEKPIYQELNWN